MRRKSKLHASVQPTRLGFLLGPFFPLFLFSLVSYVFENCSCSGSSQFLTLTLHAPSCAKRLNLCPLVADMFFSNFLSGCPTWFPSPLWLHFSFCSRYFVARMRKEELPHTSHAPNLVLFGCFPSWLFAFRFSPFIAEVCIPRPPGFYTAGF